MRVVLCPAGSRGDIQPCLVLGTMLREQGHSVHLLVPPNFEDWVKQRGFAVGGVGLDSRQMMLDNAQLARSSPATMVRRQLAVFRDEVLTQFRDFTRLAPEADLFIGAGLQLAAMSWAEKVGADCVQLLYTNAVVPVPDLPPVVFPFFGWPQWLNRGLWWLADSSINWTLRDTVNRARMDWGLAPVRRIEHQQWRKRNLLATDACFSPLSEQGRRLACQIGFLNDDAPEPVPTDIPSEGTHVFFGFGSMPDPEPVRTVELVQKAVRALGVRAVVQRGWAGLSPTDPDVVTLGDAPHGQVFDRVDAVVHHGGAGTVAAGLRAGRPQFIAPHILDQFFHGHRVHQLGLGPRPLPRPRWTLERLKRGLDALLSDRSFFANAEKMRVRLLSRLDQKQRLAAFLDERDGAALEADTSSP